MVTKYSEFVSVSQINEQLKQVVELSRQVYITALNAMLLSRRIEDNASGFSSVSKQLQDYSKNLTIHVDKVTHEIHALISDSANLVKQRHVNKLYTAALQAAGPALNKDNRQYALESIQHHFEKAEAVRDVSSQMLETTLSQLQDYSHIGNNLTVLAKIESSTVGQFTQELKAITGHIEMVMANIEHCVNAAIQINSKAA